jgi:hypothetical protein
MNNPYRGAAKILLFSRFPRQFLPVFLSKIGWEE